MSDDRAAMSAASINDLPDSAFAFIQSGGKKDASGKTVPRSLRHFPIHDAAHVRNALARAPQSPFGKQAMPKITAAAKKFGIEVGGMNSTEQTGLSERSVPFEVEPSSDGLNLEGYAAVYNSPTRIDSWEGRFDEVILPGAFARALSRRTPVLMFEHGKHPLIGSMPLGVITRHSEDSKGLHIQARLSDNWLIEPVRDAVRDGAVNGMSFRFLVDGGDDWQRRVNDVELRAIREFDEVPELGPVVFPQYEPTTATVRSLVERLADPNTVSAQSLLAQLDPDEHRTLIRELAAELRLAADLQDLTGRPAQGAGGGDPGVEPEPSSTVLSHRLRLDDGALRLRGILT